MQALGYVQEDAAKLIVPLVGGTLIVAYEDEKIRLIVLAMIGIDLISDLLYGSIFFYHHLGRKMRRIDLYDLLCLELLHHVVGYQLSHMTHARQTLDENGVFKGYFFDTGNQGLFNFASWPRALRYLP